MLAKHLSAKAAVIESMPDEDFASSMVRGFDDCLTIPTRCGCGSGRHSTRVTANWLRKRSGELFCSPRSRAGGGRRPAEALPPDADEEMLLLVSSALRVFPLILPQVVSLVTGMDPLDPEFRQRWTASLECIGRRLFAPDSKSGDEPVGEPNGPVKIRKQSPPRTATGGGRQ